MDGEVSQTVPTPAPVVMTAAAAGIIVTDVAVEDCMDAFVHTKPLLETSKPTVSRYKRWEEVTGAKGRQRGRMSEKVFGHACVRVVVRVVVHAR